MNKVREEAYISNEENMRQRINKINFHMKKMFEQIADVDKALEDLEDKADKNFKVADKAIKAHKNFLNELDARLVKHP